MPFVLTNWEEEEKEFEEFLKKNPELIPEHEARMREFEFRYQLWKAREEKQLSQKEIGKRSGLSQQAISRIERGRHSTTLGNIIKYLDALGYKLELVKK